MTPPILNSDPKNFLPLNVPVVPARKLIKTLASAPVRPLTLPVIVTGLPPTVRNPGIDDFTSTFNVRLPAPASRVVKPSTVKVLWNRILESFVVMEFFEAEAFASPVWVKVPVLESEVEKMPE